MLCFNLDSRDISSCNLLDSCSSFTDEPSYFRVTCTLNIIWIQRCCSESTSMLNPIQNNFRKSSQCSPSYVWKDCLHSKKIFSALLLFLFSPQMHFGATINTFAFWYGRTTRHMNSFFSSMALLLLCHPYMWDTELKCYMCSCTCMHIYS